jgi:hypothetical protein
MLSQNWRTNYLLSRMYKKIIWKKISDKKKTITVITYYY